MASQISVHTADVKQVLRVYSLEVPARDKEDLKEEPIVVKLRKVWHNPWRFTFDLTDFLGQAGGASYDGV